MARQNKAQISKFSEEPFIKIFILLIILPKTTFWGDREEDAATYLKKHLIPKFRLP